MKASHTVGSNSTESSGMLSIRSRVVMLFDTPAPTLGPSSPSSSPSMDQYGFGFTYESEWLMVFRPQSLKPQSHQCSRAPGSCPPGNSHEEPGRWSVSSVLSGIHHNNPSDIATHTHTQTSQARAHTSIKTAPLAAACLDGKFFLPLVGRKKYRLPSLYASIMMPLCAKHIPFSQHTQ